MCKAQTLTRPLLLDILSHALNKPKSTSSQVMCNNKLIISCNFFFSDNCLPFASVILHFGLLSNNNYC